VNAVRQITEERPLPDGARQEAGEWIEWATEVASGVTPQHSQGSESNAWKSFQKMRESVRDE